MWRIVSLAALLVALAGTAGAQTCNVAVRRDVTFGTYDPIASSPLDTWGEIAAKCAPPGSAPVARIQLGTGGSGSFSPRVLAGGGDGLAYNLYVDAARTRVWGDGTGGTTSRTLEPDVTWQSAPVYARIPPGQDVRAGSYGDAVVVTIDW